MIKQTAQTAKTLAQQIAKQIAQEPAEILKDVREQTTGTESSAEAPNKSRQHETQDKKLEEQKNIQDKMKSTRLYEAFQRELDDIHKADLFKELQSRIANGEEIPLEDYPDLSIEQKQVLMAQMEAVKIQRAQTKTEFNEVPVVRSKPSRRWGAGQKTEAEKQQTRVEKPTPPSQ